MAQSFSFWLMAVPFLLLTWLWLAGLAVIMEAFGVLISPIFWIAVIIFPIADRLVQKPRKVRIAFAVVMMLDRYFGPSWDTRSDGDPALLIMAGFARLPGAFFYYFIVFGIVSCFAFLLRRRGERILAERRKRYSPEG